MSAPRGVTPIVALDVADATAAYDLVTQLGDTCDFYKVGLELFTAVGPSIVTSLRAQGKRVFLDLKLHDIPNTVQAAARSATRHGASLLTVHASGGRLMVAAAVAGAREGQGDQPCGILGVSILTSMDSVTAGAVWGRPPIDIVAEVVRLAGEASSGGAIGMVCSGHEAAPVRAVFGDGLGLLVPGIRLPGGDAHDQRRVMTPVAARDAGARWIILGRAVTQAGDPRSVMAQIRESLAGDASGDASGAGSGAASADAPVGPGGGTVVA